MARKKQQLINYHTGSQTNMPLSGDVQLGEIVVRHHAVDPQLLIKVQNGEAEEFRTFIASGAVHTAIEAAKTTVEGNVDALETKVNTLSASVVNNYWTSAETQTAANTAEQNAKDYAVAQDKTLSGNLYTYINEVSGNVVNKFQTVEQDITALKTFSGKVETDYATKEFVGAASGYAYNQAKADLEGTDESDSASTTIKGSKKYTDEKVRELSGDVVTYVTNQIEEAAGDISELSGSVQTLSGAVETMSGDIKTYIDNELSTVYTYKNSVADYDALEAISNPEVGDVYNVVAAHGTPGEAGYTPAGTNYAWNGNEWDALGGTVDLSNYTTTGDTHAIDERLTAAENNITTASGNIATVSGSLVTLSGKVVSDYATSADTENAIENAKVAAEIASSAYTDSQIQMLSGVTSAYVANQLSDVKSDVNSLKEFTGTSAATHIEVATQSAATFESAYTAAVASAKSYTDSRETALIGGASDDANTLKKLEDQIDAVSGAATTRFETDESNISDLMNSAATWNSLTAGAVSNGELTTVATASSTQSGAKMAKNGSTLQLDLSELVIDCGDF